MTFIHESVHPDVSTYQNELSKSRLSKVVLLQTYAQTDSTDVTTSLRVWQ